MAGRKPGTQKTGGRKKGTPNKTTAALKEAILAAAKAHGMDGRGKAGLEGYLYRVARDDVKAFAGLLGKVLPLQVAGDPDAPIQIAHIELVAPGADSSD